MEGNVLFKFKFGPGSNCSSVIRRVVDVASVLGRMKIDDCGVSSAEKRNEQQSDLIIIHDDAML